MSDTKGKDERQGRPRGQFGPGGRWRRCAVAAVLVAVAAPLTGCMVGPDYHPPPAPVADQYRDAGTDSVHRETADLTNWWTVFNDPVLNTLVQTAYLQNPTLQSAAVRVLETEAQRGIAEGLLFPQDQAAVGGYTRTRLSKNQANLPSSFKRSFDNWQVGAAAAWELDIWGKFRRGINAADAQVLSAVASYDDVLVTLISEVASEYLTIRILQERLAVARANVEVQKRGLELAEARFKGGTATELDRTQATVLLRDTEATVPDLIASITEAENRLCVLLGIPPRDLSGMLAGPQAIPITPASVAVGIPAELLRRRPDVRRAERDLAAQSERIGIAKADLYPSFTLVGDVRFDAAHAANLFDADSLQAFGGPTFRWNLFNYGRIENSVRAEDARFQELIGLYEDTVLRAQADVENSVAGYVGAQQQIVSLKDGVAAAERAVQVAEAQYRGGIADYTRVQNSQQALQEEQDRLVVTRGSQALNLVSVYRAMGGGWEIRGGSVPIDERIQDQMRRRTNWGSVLPKEEPKDAKEGPKEDSKP